MEEMNNDVTEVAVPEEEAYKSGSVQYIDSREVAEIVGKEHSKLLKDIRRYIGQLDEAKIGFNEFFMESQYTDKLNRKKTCYLVTKKGCEFIAHKLTGIKGTKFTATYINRFHEMEDVIKSAEHAQIQELAKQMEVVQVLMKQQQECIKGQQECIEGLQEYIKSQQELLQHLCERQNLIEQENTGNKRFNPYGADNTAELEERKKELYSLSARVGELWNMSQSKVLHYLYLTMEEKLNLTLNAYKSVYVSETGNEEASMVEVIAADNRLYQTAARMNREAIERKQIYG